MQNTKRNKHVLINLTQNQYNALVFLADSQRRKVADIAYILLTDSIQINMLHIADIKNTGFKKLDYHK